MKVKIDRTREGLKLQDAPRCIRMFNDDGRLIGEIHFMPGADQIQVTEFEGLIVTIVSVPTTSESGE